MSEQVTKSFTITASPTVMKRFERFLALLHYNSGWGHSANFVMPLDGDGADRFKVHDFKPGYHKDVDVGSWCGCAPWIHKEVTAHLRKVEHD